MCGCLSSRTGGFGEVDFYWPGGVVEGCACQRTNTSSYQGAKLPPVESPELQASAQQTDDPSKSAGDCGCGCGGSSASSSASSSAQKPCGCRGRGLGVERSAGRITPAGQPCAFGAARLPNGRCPEDRDEASDPITADDIARAGAPTREQWQSWSPDRRAEYARQWAADQRMSAAEQRAFAERARTADYTLIAGLVTSGVNVVRDLIEARSRERIAEIEANARTNVARYTGGVTGERGLLDQTYGGNNSSSSSGSKKSSGTGLAIALGLGAMLLKGGM